MCLFQAFRWSWAENGASREQREITSGIEREIIDSIARQRPCMFLLSGKATYSAHWHTANHVFLLYYFKNPPEGYMNFVVKQRYMAVRIINRDGFFSWPTNGPVRLYSSLTSNTPKKVPRHVQLQLLSFYILVIWKEPLHKLFPKYCVQRFCNEGLLGFAYFPCRFFHLLLKLPVLFTREEPHTVLQSKIHLDITIPNNYRYGWILPTRLMEAK